MIAVIRIKTIGIKTAKNVERPETIEMLSKRLWIMFTLKAVTIPRRILCPDFWSLIGPNTKDTDKRIKARVTIGLEIFRQNSNASRFLLYSDTSSCIFL